MGAQFAFRRAANPFWSPGRLVSVNPTHAVIDFRLKLFVAGDTPRAREAAANLTRACAELLDGVAHVETIDILLDPVSADEHRVLTTPTVVRVSPAPRRRVTGDLRDVVQVLAALALHPAHPQP